MSTAARPPATSAATGSNPPRLRILRIGVLLGGKIVEERLIRERVPVSLGQSMNNTFSIPVEGLPLHFTLFAVDQGRYFLRFFGTMDGRLSDGGQVNTLEALKARGASRQGEYWQVPLGESSRGKLTLGDLTVLFQFVTEPPRQPKPMLPASVRGTFADRFPPLLVAILAIALLINSTVVIVAWFFIDPDLGSSDADLAYNQTFEQAKIDVSLDEPKKPDPTPGSAVGSAEAPKTPDKPTPAVHPSSNNKPDAGGRSQNNNVTVSEAQEQAFINAMTGEGSNGTTDQDMSNRRPASDLGQQVADAREAGRQASVGGSSGRGARGNGDPHVGTGNGPALNGPGGIDAAGGPPRESGPAGRISVSSKEIVGEGSTLTPDVVLSKIMAAYMAGLKRCYKEYLKKDASARGKVSLAFTINATGRLTSGTATGVADEVSQCIQGQMALWRFPVPKDKDGDATEAAFAITLQLVPD